MAWVTGDSVCFTTAGWVYGETLCFTTESVVKPTEAWIRVTSLIHRWSPGNYLLAIGLGELTTEFDIPDIIRKERPSWMEPTPEPGPTEGCVYGGVRYSEGSYICQGADRFVCFEGRWRLDKKNAPECKDGGPPAAGCTYQGITYPEGAYVCMGRNQFVCFGGRWRLNQRNAPECM